MTIFKKSKNLLHIITVQSTFGLEILLVNFLRTKKKLKHIHATN